MFGYVQVPLSDLLLLTDHDLRILVYLVRLTDEGYTVVLTLTETNIFHLTVYFTTFFRKQSEDEVKEPLMSACEPRGSLRRVMQCKAWAQFDWCIWSVWTYDTTTAADHRERGGRVVPGDAPSTSYISTRYTTLFVADVDPPD